MDSFRLACTHIILAVQISCRTMLFYVGEKRLPSRSSRSGYCEGRPHTFPNRSQFEFAPLNLHQLLDNFLPACALVTTFRHLVFKFSLKRSQIMTQETTMQYALAPWNMSRWYRTVERR